MEKISTIFASSPRVQAVDTEDSPPARPGAPRAGRVNGRTPADHDRVTLSPVAKEAAFNDTIARKNPHEEEGRQIIERSTKDFFNTRMKDMGENPAEESAAEHRPEIQEARENLQSRGRTMANPIVNSPRTINKYA